MRSPSQHYSEEFVELFYRGRHLAGKIYIYPYKSYSYYCLTYWTPSTAILWQDGTVEMSFDQETRPPKTSPESDVSLLKTKE